MRNRFAFIFSLLFIATFQWSAGQGSNSAIKKDFNDYLNLLEQKQYNKSLDYVPAEIFEIIPRDQMLAAMESVFKSPEVSMDMNNYKIDSIGNTQNIDNKKYVFISYSFDMGMKYNIEEEESVEDKTMRVNMMKGAFVQQFGKQQVSYDEKTEYFKIKVKSDAYAISGSEYDGWKFITIDKSQMQLLDKVLPQAIIDQL